MLQSLERQSGLPIAFDPLTCAIRWEGGLDVEAAAERTFAEMKDCIAEPDAIPTRDPVYTVYRNVRRSGDAAKIDAAGLRYDITVIPPGYFAGNEKEFFRTAGHYHALLPERDIAYPEAYEVVSGRAFWLIQRPSRNDAGTLEEIYIVEAAAGEKAVIPPNFGHISINASSEPLVLANWIAAGIAYDYRPYRELRGGGARAVDGSVPDTIEFETNRRYRQVPEMQKLRPKETAEFGLARSLPAYALVNDLARLAFLRAPHEFGNLLTIDSCFRRVV